MIVALRLWIGVACAGLCSIDDETLQIGAKLTTPAAFTEVIGMIRGTTLPIGGFSRRREPCFTKSNETELPGPGRGSTDQERSIPVSEHQVPRVATLAIASPATVS